MGDVVAFRPCPECLSRNVRTEYEDHKFLYGVENPVELVVLRMPIRCCESCGFEYLDEVAEEMQDEVVRRHLGIKV